MFWLHRACHANVANAGLRFDGMVLVDVLAILMHVLRHCFLLVLVLLLRSLLSQLYQSLPDCIMLCLTAKAHLMAARERQAAAPDLASEAQPSDRQGRRGADEAGSDRHKRGGTAHYLHDVKSSRSQMRKPSDSSSLSWR